MQGACVQNVLDSVVDALLHDPNRKFVFAEMVNGHFSSFESDHVFVCVIIKFDMNLYRRFSNDGGQSKVQKYKNK